MSAVLENLSASTHSSIPVKVSSGDLVIMQSLVLGLAWDPRFISHKLSNDAADSQIAS